MVKVMMRSVLQCKTQESVLIQRAGNASLTLSIVRKPTDLAWACRSAVPSSKVTVDGYGPYRMRVPAQPFNLPFLNAISLHRSQILKDLRAMQAVEFEQIFPANSYQGIIEGSRNAG